MFFQRRERAKGRRRRTESAIARLCEFNSVKERTYPPSMLEGMRPFRVGGMAKPNDSERLCLELG